MDTRDEAFGTPEQQSMFRRGRAMFEVIRDDPRFTSYGRTVGIARPEDADIETLRALAALQGAGHFAAAPAAEAPALVETLTGCGLSVSASPS